MPGSHEEKKRSGELHQQPFSFHPSFHEFYEGTQSISPCIHSIFEHSISKLSSFVLRLLWSTAIPNLAAFFTSNPAFLSSSNVKPRPSRILMLYLKPGTTNGWTEKGCRTGSQVLQHALCGRDDDVVYVQVDRTMSELDVASPENELDIKSK